jgi:uncharacterized protein YceH (UPF0502 family)
VPSQIALLAVLMLRGPQTPGELKSRVERLYPFGSTADVEQALGALAGADLAEKLPRRPGQSQDRWAHLLGGAEPADGPQRSTEIESDNLSQGAYSGAATLEERVARLEGQVAELQRALAER